MKAALAALAPLASSALLAGCGPSLAPVSAAARPCPEISQGQFEAALANGAARGDANIRRSGMVDLRFGPGVVHCASFNSPIRPCRRPNALVIRYDIEGGAPRFVHVPADAEYRFKVANRPTTCEIVGE